MGITFAAVGVAAGAVGGSPRMGLTGAGVGVVCHRVLVLYELERHFWSILTHQAGLQMLTINKNTMNRNPIDEKT